MKKPEVKPVAAAVQQAAQKPQINGAQALMNAVIRQRDQANNLLAQAEAKVDVLIADNERLNAEIDALKTRVAELEPKESQDGNEVADGAGAGSDGPESGHANDAGL